MKTMLVAIFLALACASIRAQQPAPAPGTAGVLLSKVSEFMDHCGPAPASNQAGNQALTQGTHQANGPVCAMYVYGIFSGIQLYDVITAQHSTAAVTPDRSFCPRYPLSANDLKNVVVHYIQTHPTQPTDNTDLVALLAFEEAYPCPAK